MMLARITRDGDRAEARPGARAWCPQCDQTVIAKCGELVVWHWAHESVTDCDPWAEHESAWHLAWKARVAPEHREVVMGPHRADIALPNGRVIELQHSSLSPEDVRTREAFYGPGLIWVIDASEFSDRLIFRHQRRFATFRWKTPRKWQWTLTQPVVWDLGQGSLFCVRRVHDEVPCGGWGRFMRADEWFRNVTTAPPYYAANEEFETTYAAL
jgi:hypothetical protein